MKLREILEEEKDDRFIISKPVIIAEAGVNHEGSMDLAKRLIDEAKEGGAQVIKFQTYKAEMLASKNSPAYWDTSKEPTLNQYELFKKHDKFWKNEFEEIKKYCDKVNIEFLSTPFDLESAKFLNDLMDVFKISSSDLTNFPFIEYICQFGKPILLSTGASYMWEIQRTFELIRKHGNPVSLMHCVLNYPTSQENANLGMILDLRKKFPGTIIGYSDHTLPQDMENLLIANFLGARIIEKHFTFDKTLPGNDHYHAMDKEDLKLFWRKWSERMTAIGSFEKMPLESEFVSRENARRSLVARRNIKKGKVITSDDLTWKRPAFGISPTDFWNVVGKIAKVAIKEDEILQWNMFE